MNSQLSPSERVLMIVKEGGSYQATTTRDGGTLTVGPYDLQAGKVRYKSSRSEGTVVISEDKGKTTQPLSPEGSFNPVTGPASYGRVK